MHHIPFTQGLWSVSSVVPRVNGIPSQQHYVHKKTSTNKRTVPPLRTKLRLMSPQIIDIPPAQFWTLLTSHLHGTNTSTIAVTIIGSLNRDRISHITSVFRYFLDLMSHVPDNLIATRNNTPPESYHAPKLSLNCELGTTEIQLSHRMSLEAQLSREEFKTILFMRQSHIVLSFIEYSTHRLIRVHFLLCSTGLLIGGRNLPYFSADRPFFRIPEIPVSVDYALMIGILGPSVDYSSSGVDLRNALNAYGSSGWRGFREVLERHTLDWKPVDMESYRERKGIIWERKCQRADMSTSKPPIGRHGADKVKKRVDRPATAINLGMDTSPTIIDSKLVEFQYSDPDTSSSGNQYPELRVTRTPQNEISMHSPTTYLLDTPSPSISDPAAVGFSPDLISSSPPSTTSFPISLRLDPMEFTRNTLSLADLTRNLLWARQRGRYTKYCKRWELVSCGPGTFDVHFGGKLIPGIPGITMRSFHEECGKGYICVFGCTKNGKRRWLSSPERQKNHTSPKLSGGGVCLSFPGSLSVTTAAQFQSPRELVGVTIYFRETREQKGHLTSLFVLGNALLDYAVWQLGMTELNNQWKFERGGILDTRE